MEPFQNQRIHLVSDINECRRLLQILESYAIISSAFLRAIIAMNIVLAICLQLFHLFLLCFFQTLRSGISGARLVKLLI